MYNFSISHLVVIELIKKKDDNIFIFSSGLILIKLNVIIMKKISLDCGAVYMSPEVKSHLLS